MMGSVLRRVDGTFGIALLGVIVLTAAGASFWFPDDPLSIVAPPLTAPFTHVSFPLGSDRLGRDVLAELVHGARTSLAVGLAAACAALVIGAIVGTLAGFLGGWSGGLLMRVTDAFQTVPSFLLALAFVSIVGPSLFAIVIAIALGAWPGPARIARGEVLSIRERDYVAAARVVGMHPLVIAFREILPNALPPLVSLTAVIVSGAILTEAALSFLGLGDPNRVTWGGMIAEGRPVLRSVPSLSIIPGIALIVTVLAVYLIGEAVNDVLAGRRRTP